MGQALRIVALGDSVTAGSPFSGVTPETCFVPLAQQRLLAAGLDLEWIRSALDGIDAAYAVKRFHRLATVHEPDLVLVMLGLNDARPPGARAAASPEEFEQNVLGLTERILAIDARPVLATPTPRPCEAPGGESPMAPYAAAVERVCDHFQLACVPVHDRFTAAGREALRWLVPDGTHPSPAGHALIADVVCEHLAPLLGGGRLAVAPQWQRRPSSVPADNVS